MLRQPTPDLDAFLAAVRPRSTAAAVPVGGSSGGVGLASCRVKYVELSGKVKMATIKLDPRYWATGELRMTRHGWRRVDFDLEKTQQEKAEAVTAVAPAQSGG